MWRRSCISLLRRECGCCAREPGTLTPMQRRVLKTPPILRPVTLHQKFAIADAVDCIIGGMDIDERRWDTPDHDRPAEQTWHDVSMRVSGDFVGKLRSHLADSWNIALDCGAASLADQAERMEGSTQSRTTVPRLVRTLSSPCLGFATLEPKAAIGSTKRFCQRLQEGAALDLHRVAVPAPSPACRCACRAARRAPTCSASSSFRRNRTV